MDKFWSNRLMGIESMDTIRNLKFHKNSGNTFSHFLPIKANQKILDVGCGTGSLTRGLYDWFNGDLTITGIDFDEGYIDYCKNIAKEKNYKIEYETGDINSLNYSNSLFDISISSSVIEHVENIQFFKEQFRILKNNGYIIILNVAGLKVYNGFMDEICPVTDEEKELRKEIVENVELNNRKNSNRFLMYRKPKHIWLKMLEEYGFCNISHNIVKICYSTDNQLEDDFKKLIIDNLYSDDMDLIYAAKNNSRDDLLINKTNRFYTLINEKKNKRIELLRNGIKIWDYIDTDYNILTGQKVI